METPLPGCLFFFFFFFFVGALWASERREAVATVFTLQNKCSYTVWPGTLSGNGAAVLGGGGFELSPNAAVSLTAPPGWSGRFWARTACVFPPSGVSGSCTTGDCGGAIRCSFGGTPPVTLAEFTLAGGGNGAAKDFYDVSLVDGYNVGMGVRPAPASSGCKYAGCVADLNGRCPAELRVAGMTGETVACRSACEAFGGPEYCCTGAHGSPGTCGPTRYSQLFKAACPTAYSYAYDDATSTFTCSAASEYLITFCPAADD
uniref:Pathogenesis-related protein 5 n=1 Tax=Elaeis guineensis var. tenera TaxID=51953 RepID=A0A6I9S2W7_ELAGV|nr:pathogenesis-related protein 5 [Elaeis guineensis]